MTSPLWERIERYETGPDYRIPYDLSNDYWLYERMLRQTSAPNRIVVLGDSVVWGEYVLPDGALSHFLNQQAGVSDRYINGGLNGSFPLALEGLIDYYGQALRHCRVIVHCNVLWMTSPKADLSTEKEERFNHSGLVPQFCPRIPCYKADADERLGAVVEREFGFVQWVKHLQSAYFERMSIPKWTLEEDNGTPPRRPNLWRNPLRQITLTVPEPPPEDPQRGPTSSRHKPWSEDGEGAARFDWVPLGSSLQWQAFQRLIGRLQDGGNDVLVVVGPFNEHMMATENRPAYSEIRNGIAAWLTEHNILHVVPEALPSALYADASHPLTEGYELLAQRLYENPDFQRWVRGE
ncbi:MAG: SGNH/GDSL hydrolase family protein [Candidatus Sumerlaeota bacterium]|nr:SGNH/GDSL hydrolase family protein [Candidatus Sumerlaeota bacterium]